MKHAISGTTNIIGGALVIPQGLLEQRMGSTQFCVDAVARARVERIAMEASIMAETSLGHCTTDVSAKKCGWDITAYIDQPQGLPLKPHIEVKGRAKGQSTITVTRNEISCELNQKEKFMLAVVIVDGNSREGPYYVRQPFAQELDWAEASKNLDLSALLQRAVSPRGRVTFRLPKIETPPRGWRWTEVTCLGGVSRNKSAKFNCTVQLILARREVQP